MKSLSKNQIMEQAKFLGVCVQVNSPGDGKTRYEFCTPGPVPYTVGRTIGYCIGAREAEVWLRGYHEGHQAGEVF